MYVTERATQARREIAHNAKQKGRLGGQGGGVSAPLQKKRRECTQRRRERPPAKETSGMHTKAARAPHAMFGTCACKQTGQMKIIVIFCHKPSKRQKKIPRAAGSNLKPDYLLAFSQTALLTKAVRLRPSAVLPLNA